MNRQAVAFISLFSLILMLSVYYVTLDDNSISVIEPQDHETVKVDDQSVMKDQVDGKLDEEILKQKEVLGSNEPSEAEKSEALEKISFIESVKKSQEDLTKLLTDKGYKNLVEISDSLVRITIYEESKSNELANEIMLLVYPLIDSEKSVEIYFG